MAMRRMKTEQKTDFIDEMEKSVDQTLDRIRSAESDVGPNVFPTKDVGETVTVTWGADKYSPVQYNTIEMPNFSRTTTVRAGETATDAMRRALTDCENLAQEYFDKKLAAFSKNYLRFAKKTG